MIINSEFCKKSGIDYSQFNFDTLIKSNKLADLYSKVVETYHAKDDIYKKAKLQIAVLYLLIELCEHYTLSDKKTFKESTSFGQVKITIRFIRENYNQKLTLDIIAKNVLADKFNLEYAVQVEHPDRYELNGATAKIEQCDRKDCTLTAIK